MVINQILEKIFAAPSFVSILRILNERVTGITGREAARLSGLSSRTAQYVLSDLTDLGIVERQIGGRDYLYSLNRESFLSDRIVKDIFESEKKFKNEVYRFIRNKLSNISESLIVFGSVSRHEETVESDLDLCIIYNKNKKEIGDKISVLRNDLFKKYNINLAPFVISQTEFKKRAVKNDPPVKDIISDAIIISGKSINDLLSGKKSFGKKSRTEQV